MFSFENFLDLPLIWYGLITTAMFLYVILDGFDLGVGILFPFAPTDKCRNRMMNSIATLAARFSAHRMVMDYVEKSYLVAAGGLSSSMDMR